MNPLRAVSGFAVAIAAITEPAPLPTGPATQLVILLPGQTLSSGGISGSPLPQRPRHGFDVRVVAVDQFFQRDYGYSGPLVGIQTSESVPTAGRRFATSVSAAGAATVIPPGGGELRISINGEEYRDYLVGPATTGDAVCGAIEATIVTGNAGRELAIDCTFDATSSRYTLFMDDGQPLRRNLLGTYPENTLTIDPAHGLAPSLHLGVTEPPSSDPDDASEFAARRLVANPAIDLVFDRGLAAFRVRWNALADLGPSKTITLNQGAAGLPVASTPFTVQAAPFKINAATAIGDGNGRINRVRLAFNQHIDPASLAGQAGNFTLLDTTGIEPPRAGTSLTLENDDLQGYAASTIEVTFGAGLGRTDVTNVEVIYSPPASNRIQSLDTGVALASGTVPPLVDGAPPVLVSAFGQDIDSNNGLDRMVFFLSEPVAFSGGRGVSISGFEPATDTTAAAVPLPASLVLAIDGQAHVLTLSHPTNPAATQVAGGSDVADAITIAARNAGNRPALVNFTCEFVNGRYVLRAGIPLRSVTVSPSPLSDDAAPLLRLGNANGGVERPGSGNGIVDQLEDFIVLSPEGQDLLRRSLLEGLNASSLSISGNELQIALTNVPNSGTATPAYLWKDNGDLAFLADRAPVPNHAGPANNVGLSADFHPSALIRIHDDDSVPGDGTITKSPGNVTLDATQTIPPLLPSNTPADLSFYWSQSGGVPVIIDNAASDDASAQMLRAGTYVFKLTVTVLDGGVPPPFNPYVHGDGTLGKTVSVAINPGPAANVVVLLPGENLVQGVLSHAEAIGGMSGIATPGVPYAVRLVCTDSVFNAIDCPAGVTASLSTTDPSDVELASQPLAPAGATFTLFPVTVGSFSVDDVLAGLSESSDSPRTYVVGSSWSSVAARIPGSPDGIRLSWPPDARPGVTWNLYAGALPMRDLDHDGLPDLGYGSCVTGQDPKPGDTTFDDLAVPPAGSGRFYLGTMVLDGQETSPGVTSAGLVRAVTATCP